MKCFQFKWFSPPRRSDKSNTGGNRKWGSTFMSGGGEGSTDLTKGCTSGLCYNSLWRTNTARMRSQIWGNHLLCAVIWLRLCLFLPLLKGLNLQKIPNPAKTSHRGAGEVKLKSQTRNNTWKRWMQWNPKQTSTLCLVRFPVFISCLDGQFSVVHKININLNTKKDDYSMLRYFISPNAKILLQLFYK